MKKYLKGFSDFSVNEKMGVISGIHGFSELDNSSDTEETKKLRAKAVSDMRREVGADLPGYEEGYRSSALEEYKRILDDNGWGYIEGPEGGPQMYIWPNVENIEDSSVQIILNPGKEIFIASSDNESGEENPMTLENIEGFERGVKAAMRLKELENL